MQTNRATLTIAAALALIVPAFFLFVPPIAQDQAYHSFADSRSVWSIANFWNVVSNLPFAMVGLLGLGKLRGAVDRVLFTGVLLTFFGSAYYHLAPSDARLVWDRLPMTLVFMALLACVLSAENDPRFRLAARPAGELRRRERTVVEHHRRSSLVCSGAVRPASDSHSRALVCSRGALSRRCPGILWPREARRIWRSRGFLKPSH